MPVDSGPLGPQATLPSESDPEADLYSPIGFRP